MDQIYSFTIEPTQEDQRIDVFLVDRLHGQVPSRVFIQTMIEEACITVNGKAIKPRYRIRRNDVVHVRIPSQRLPPGVPKGEDIPVDRIYEDDAIFVLHKPAGLLVHPAPNVYTGTLVNALLHRKIPLSDFHSDPYRPGIVHRLDQETSGVMVVAKTEKAHRHLAEQFASHQVYKKYVALVEGSVAFDEGEINAPLRRDPVHRDRRSVQFVPEAKTAVTIYRVRERWDRHTVVHLFPKSGRTHQLRVHMRYLGHPILGDAKYGSPGTFPRLALHAQAIRFRHPYHDDAIEFSVPVPRQFMTAKTFLEKSK